MSAIVERESNAKAIVAQKMKQIETLVGQDKGKASAYASALVSLTSDKNLIECSIESIIDVGFQIVQAGLNPNKLFNEAYVVPFNLKDGSKWIKSAQLQIGVKGYVTLAYRAGWIVKARIVYKCDEFTLDMSKFDEDFHYVPNLEKQDNTNPEWVFANVKGVIVMAKDSKGNEFKQYVPNSKIEQIRLKSQNQKNKNAYEYIWKDWSEEMISAKAIKYVLKRLPISDAFMGAVVNDEVFERGDYIDAKPKEIKKTAPNMNEI